MKSLGICCGASTITAVEMVCEAKKARIVNVVSLVHDGNPKMVVAELLFSLDLESCDRMASTFTDFQILALPAWHWGIFCPVKKGLEFG
jgi:hypothetical protein